MPNIHNVLADVWNHFRLNDTIAQQIRNLENQHDIAIELQQSDVTLRLPSGTTLKRGALIEIIGRTPTLVRNTLFTTGVMHAIMNLITEQDEITLH